MIAKMDKQHIVPNFLEIVSTEEANEVNLEVFRLEKFSESRNAYIFVKRRMLK